MAVDLPLSGDELGGLADDDVERPVVRLTPRQWVRANLFSSPLNAVLTVVFGVVLAWVSYRVLRFVFVTAEWEIVRVNLRRFMVDSFPQDQIWRVWTAIYVLAATIGLVAGVIGELVAAQARARDLPPPRDTLAGSLRRWWPLLLLFVVLVGFTRTVVPGLLLLGALVVLLLVRSSGGRLLSARWTWVVVGVALVGTHRLLTAGGLGWDEWGGLMLTLFVSVAGIVLAVPLGLLLALGRRSTLPAVRAVSIGYIELFRGVPLITLLFSGQFIVPLFFPNTVEPPGALSRALIVIVLFEGAYIAEVVRGGLQAVPKGQYEAAQAVGLSPWKTLRFVVLPQAIRAVVPGMVGQFISLFKDTTLLVIIGFNEILDLASDVTVQPEFLGKRLHTVTFVFVGFIFWVVSYTMSRESRRLERRLGLGVRR